MLQLAAGLVGAVTAVVWGARQRQRTTTGLSLANALSASTGWGAAQLLAGDGQGPVHLNPGVGCLYRAAYFGRSDAPGLLRCWKGGTRVAATAVVAVVALWQAVTCEGERSAAGCGAGE